MGLDRRDQRPLISTDGTQYSIVFGITSLFAGSTVSSAGQPRHIVTQHSDSVPRNHPTKLDLQQKHRHKEYQTSINITGNMKNKATPGCNHGCTQIITMWHWEKQCARISHNKGNNMTTKKQNEGHRVLNIKETQLKQIKQSETRCTSL
jgi:hypothetical protein